MSSSNADGEDLLSEASTADVNNTMAASAPSHPPPPPFNPLQGGEEVIVSSNDRLKVNNAEETTGRLPHEITHESSSGGMTMTMAAHPSSLAARIVPPPLPLAISSSGGIQHSVVPDLMRVYESLTQSSTPQTTAPPPQKDTPEQSSQPGSQSQEAQHAEATMGQDASVEPYPYYSAPQGEEGHEGWHAPGTASAWTAPHEANPTSIPIPPPMHQVPPMEMQPSQSSRPSRSSGRSSAAERIAEAPTRNRSLRKRKQEAIEANYPSSGNSSGGSSSRGGGASKSRRKSGKSKGDVGDGRWSKRFTWPEELHRDFVSAIFDVGLQHSSPSTVLEHMPPHEQINSERIKSHLQKYRLHRQKSKKEFMSQYAASLQQFQKSGLEGVTSLAAGQVAGHLAYAALTLPDPVVPQEEPGGDTTAQQQRPGQSQKAPSYPSQQDMLVLPRLTEEEKQSPVGVASTFAESQSMSLLFHII
jgi:SHAQKYF class myb-like DNA-binding protein